MSVKAFKIKVPQRTLNDLRKRQPHTATLRFPKPGLAVIHVWGRRIGSNTLPGGVPTVIERRVTIK